jgi:poly(3-hydroxybutyrate) depolymerase
MRAPVACALIAVLALVGCGADDPPPSDLANAGGGGTLAADGSGGVASAGQAGGAAAAGVGAAGAAGASGADGAADVSGSGGAGGSNSGVAGAGAGGAGTAGSAATSPESSTALAELEGYLALPRAQRPELAAQPFASVALTRADAERAASLLWEDFAAMVRETRASEVGATESQAASITLGGSTLRYYMAVRGAEPASGRSLFISMHGGGNAPAATNDSQWENQIALVEGYAPVEAIWIAPRAPIDDWNMWFVEDIDPLFERLITNMIAFEGVDPNKVYINGYSAGGDGVYQLGPRMADCWAGAAMSAGHPNDASPVNLRNVAFAIHVGGNDTAYDRNVVAAEWGQMLEDLAAADGAGGYPNQWQVHAGLPHWMELEDAVAIPFVQMYARDPAPPKVVWRQVDVARSRFYWLAVAEADVAKGTTVTAEYEPGLVTLSDVSGLPRLTLRFSDAMLDLDQPLRVEHEGTELFAGTITRSIGVLYRTLQERGDPAMMFMGEATVALP